MDMDEVGLVNCCACQAELCGERTVARIRHGEKPPPGCPPPVGGRINGRPWCESCLEGYQAPVEPEYPSRRLPPGRAPILEDTSPWQDIAIRAMEG